MSRIHQILTGIYLVVFSTVGHYTLSNGEDISLTKQDLEAAVSRSETSPTWTFSTSLDLKIQFVFRDFDIPNYVLVGDGQGLDENEALLANFSGDCSPSNVISVSSNAWFRTSIVDSASLTSTSCQNAVVRAVWMTQPFIQNIR